MTRQSRNIIFDLYSSAYLAPFTAGSHCPSEARLRDAEPAIPGHRRFWGRLVITAAAGLILGVLLGVLPQDVTL
ncbi:hypothetical protein [Aestuariivirga sp.]|uniref:hypothetical protein n=1 Tax=Aestuariivirga sp. TaxID=2650926 RepID=UPI00391D0E86